MIELNVIKHKVPAILDFFNVFIRELSRPRIPVSKLIEAKAFECICPSFEGRIQFVRLPIAPGKKKKV